MPKELARVMARYNTMQDQATPLLSQLTNPGHDYIMMKDHISILLDDLADQLRDLRAGSAADPRAANNPGVKGTLKEIEKRKILMADRGAAMDAAAKKLDAIHDDAVKLHTDVVAVIKAKSGFFTRSKSLPALKALSTTLVKFAADLDSATSVDY